MHAFGIYDYKINTETFQDASQYIKSLQEKAATSSQDSMFQMEAEALSRSSSSGLDFGVIGSIVGGLVGAKAGGAQGDQMGAQIGQALGQSISLNIGSSTGSSSNSQNGNFQAEASSKQSASKSSRSQVNMIAVLEANMKLFEVTLDELKPDDMSASFFADVMQLPTSYTEIGAQTIFEDFILRYGTHFIKSAKFGGELKVMKTSKKESTLSAEQFAVTAQSEFAGMMSTLRSSVKQKSSGWTFLGLGSKKKNSKRTTSLQSSSERKQEASLSAASSQQASRSEFIKTTIEVEGGDPSIAAAITDFYTPRFRETFLHWLNSIEKNARPYEFTLGKISDVLNFSPQALFKTEQAESGCFGANVTTDVKTGKTHYLRKISRLDAQDKTVETTVEVPCKFGTSRQSFINSLRSMRLALERAENIYMTEGPISSSSFDIQGGEAGCDQDALKYADDSDVLMKRWPSWEEMKQMQFKVKFEMKRDLPSIPKDAELVVRYYDNLWWTRKPSGSFKMVAACPNAQELSNKSLCIAGVPFIYSESDGVLKLDLFTYSKFKVQVPFWLMGPLAKAEEMELIKSEKSQVGTIGLIPCNLKWSNRHQIRVDANLSCMYFQAASAGSLNIILAGLPENHKTWYYLRISPQGISFYQAMKIEKVDMDPKIGSLGSESLYESYFICLRKMNNELLVQYGKGKEYEVSLVYASYKYKYSLNFDNLFYAFGTGEEKVSIRDLHIEKDSPSNQRCMRGLLYRDGQCFLQCHPQCDGCHQANDTRACKKCRNLTFKTGLNTFVCIEKCPGKTVKRGSTCECQFGFRASRENNIDSCTKCDPGKKGNGIVCEDCPRNTRSNGNFTQCLPCGRDRWSGPGSSKCMTWPSMGRKQKFGPIENDP